MTACKIKTLALCLLMAAAGATALATQYHVATNGSDAYPGKASAPFRTIQHAAELAQPGDTITVHRGVYRERIDPPRGGTSETRRIVYQAAAGEHVVITGAEPLKNWVKLTNDVWRATLPNSFFGGFNPYSDLIHGDWFNPQGRQHHTGCVYLNGDWLMEAGQFNELLQHPGQTPLWFAQVDGMPNSGPEYLMNLAWLRTGTTKLPLDKPAAKSGTRLAACSEGGQCVGWIKHNDWLQFDGVDFAGGTDTIEFRAAAPSVGGCIELHLDTPGGERLGICQVSATGDWQKWQTFAAKIKPLRGPQRLCLVFTQFSSAPLPPKDCTEIYAQFPGLNPNEAAVEINVRPTVFTPTKTGINFLTLRGFELRNAATPWAPPTAGQVGLVSAYWCKGWLIENNDISYSKCSGVALGKYSDEWDNRAESAEGYVGTVNRALTNGWNQATVGSHLVRNNHIHHCEQTGIVGSLGCAFSTVSGNDIHDIHVRALFGGAEMAGIKFHGAIDVVISHNHIYQCGSVAGLWLDWMAQGVEVSANLMHDNSSMDIFFEMQHGPILVANNLFLSTPRAFGLNSQGIAFAHNLVVGGLDNARGDGRSTPYHPAHETSIAGLYPCPQGDSGDHRFFNNLCGPRCNLGALDNSALPCLAAGNVFTRGAQPSKCDTLALLQPDFDPGIQLQHKPDGWYLTLHESEAWRSDVSRPEVTTSLLGKAKVSNCLFENRDGSPLRLARDYFGKKRAQTNPFPGPFERPASGSEPIKVW